VRTVLTPSARPSVEEPRVALQARLGAEPEPFHHARAKALDERVDRLDDLQHRAHALRALQVDADRRPAPIDEVPARRAVRLDPDLVGPVEAPDVGTEVGQQHRRERAGADTGELENLDPVQWTHRRSAPNIQYKNLLIRSIIPATGRAR